MEKKYRITLVSTVVCLAIICLGASNVYGIGIYWYPIVSDTLSEYPLYIEMTMYSGFMEHPELSLDYHQNFTKSKKVGKSQYYDDSLLTFILSFNSECEVKGVRLREMVRVDNIELYPFPKADTYSLKYARVQDSIIVHSSCECGGFDHHRVQAYGPYRLRDELPDSIKVVVSLQLQDPQADSVFNPVVITRMLVLRHDLGQSSQWFNIINRDRPRATFVKPYEMY